MNGEVLKDGLKNEAMKDALDLCLACKGCKKECPVNVDMATYKAEFLSHYYERKIRPRSAYSMGQIGVTARLAGKVPSIANFFTQTPGLSTLAKKIGGIHPERKMPAFAKENFRTWFAKNKKTTGGRPVILWTDTFNTYFHPHVAQAATRVLEGTGFAVDIPKKPFCCGRPLYDYGFLDQAKARLRTILTEMQREIRDGTPIVVLEPSCASVFKDELVNLFPNDVDAMRLKKQVFLLSDFLELEAPDFDWPQLDKKALVQGHCHHRSIFDIKTEQKILTRVGLDAELMDSGCCGMAGAFGFEKEHYDISKKAAERALLPRLSKEATQTTIIANGFSCREQIQDLAHRPAQHLAEILSQSLELNAQPRQEPKHSRAQPSEITP